MRITPAAPEDCSEAFAEGLIAALCEDGHTFDPVDNELNSAARLTVVLTRVAPSDDLCSPPGAVGYSGSKNQAIRVQLIAPDRFLWGLDNASALYRVAVSRTGTGNKRNSPLTLCDEFFGYARRSISRSSTYYTKLLTISGQGATHTARLIVERSPPRLPIRRRGALTISPVM